MSYDTLAHIVKVGGTITFSLFFAGVVLYTLWPKNKSRFDRAAQLPLAKEDHPKV